MLTLQPLHPLCVPFVVSSSSAVGVGTNDSGCYINKNMNSVLLHPLCWLKKKFFLSASGVSDTDPNADLMFADRLADLQRNMTDRIKGKYGKCHIMAFDQFYNEDGTPEPNKSGFCQNIETYTHSSIALLTVTVGSLSQWDH